MHRRRNDEIMDTCCGGDRGTNASVEYNTEEEVET